MAGYVRQSAADIVPTAVVRAAPINNELNALRDAFAQAGGHKHDGTAAEGHYVPLISDANAYNKVVVDSTNNRISLYVNVSSAAVEQLRITDGALLPVTDNDIDLGSTTFEFKDLWIDGTANIDSLIADTADINGGTIDGAVIGASSAAAATVTNLTVNTAATIASADINGGTIDGAVIGASSAQAVTGTTITATTGFVGPLTGAVTGNVTGDVTGNVTGNLTGNVTGNVTASSGTSTFNDVVINGGLNMNAGTTATITNLTSPTNTNDAATKGYVDTAIANLVDSAPGTLDTLNELAAALGDDASFATTITTSIATKLALSGGTMTGAIAMGTNKITGLGDPTANQDAATKIYVDNADALKLSLSGGTMTGNIVMGSNKVTSTATPTTDDDLTRKGYVDSILGSATSAAASASAAATSASNAASSATAASNSASSASASASAAAASYDSFDDRYLGAKTSDPAVDNDGNSLLTGALYFNSSAGEMRVWSGSAWVATYLPASGYLALSGGTMTGDITFAGTQTFPGTLTSSDVGTTVQAYDADLTTWAGKTAPTGVVVGTTDTQTLTNKTISADNNTLSGIAASSFVLSNASGNIDGAAAQKAIPAGVVVGTTDTQTLTNKTLSTGTALGATVTGNDSLLTRVMLQDTGWDFYDSSTTNALDYVNGSVQRWAPNTGAQTLTISNWPPSGAMGELLVQGVNLGAATITWPTINWIKSDGTTTTTFSSNGVTLQASGTDWFILWTRDGGTTIYGKFVR